MADITAAMVKDLREKSGAGMMDCKKALSENAGDMEQAMDWLRTKGLAAAAKKSSRTAAEGLVGVAVSGTKGAAVEVNSETDFVAILDSNVSPDGIAFPVPANDDAARAIRLYCEAIAIAATRGGQEQQRRTGADIGAMIEPPKEEAIAEPTVEATADTAQATANADTAAEFAAEGERQIDA